MVIDALPYFPGTCAAFFPLERACYEGDQGGPEPALGGVQGILTYTDDA